MAAGSWGTPGALGSDLSGTTLNSLANNGTAVASTTFDNSSSKAYYALVELVLGSFNATATAPEVWLEMFLTPPSGTAPDKTQNGGQGAVAKSISTGTSVKRVVWLVQMPGPFVTEFMVTNKSGGTFAASGNSLKVSTFGETIV